MLCFHSLISVVPPRLPFFLLSSVPTHMTTGTSDTFNEERLNLQNIQHYQKMKPESILNAGH